jgi:hypothetical protein
MTDAMLKEKLAPMVSWNSFAASLVTQIEQGRKLSLKQKAAAIRMLEKMKENASKRESMSVSVDMSAINSIFEAAVSSGLKRPAFRIGDLMLSIAGANSRNCGQIYVKKSGDYCGRIDLENVFRPVATCPVDVPAMLERVARDPLGVAVEHGRLTGACACCGRQLTDPESVARGIGPICASRWGLL